MNDPIQPQAPAHVFPLETARAPITNKQPGELRNFYFLLQENFSMMALTSALDALRTANLISEEELYSFRLVSLDGHAVGSDLGFSAMADQALGSLWNGVFALAHAGIMDGKACVVHRENKASFRESFADIDLKDKAYIIDRQCFSCAGGNSALDMMLELMLQARGKIFVRGICDILTCDRINDRGEPAFLSDQADAQLPQNLKDIIGLMENNMEEMLSAEEIASLVGITRRQIERQFQRYLGSTPTRYYLELRLKRCHQLLTQTQLSMSDISLACGFVSYPHFSKCYRQYFEVTPSHTRRQS